MGWPLTSTNWVMSSSPLGGMNYWSPADWVSLGSGAARLRYTTRQHKKDRKTERQKDRKIGGVVRGGYQTFLDCLA